MVLSKLLKCTYNKSFYLPIRLPRLQILSGDQKVQKSRSFASVKQRIDNLTNSQKSSVPTTKDDYC